MRSYSEKPPARSDIAEPTSIRSQPADEPPVLGNALMTALTLIMNHTHPTAMGPSAPSPELASLLSLAVKRT